MITLTVVPAFLWYASEKKLAAAGGGAGYKAGADARKQKLKAAGIVFAFLSFLPMFLVNALMSYVGNDYQNYYSYYKTIISGGVQEVEFTYKLICMLVYHLGLGFQWVYVIYSLISHVVLLMCLKKYSANYAFSYMMFFFNAYFGYLGLNQIRQFVSVMLVFYAFSYIEERKMWKYLILVLIAGSFHFTALIMLPFYWILHVKWKLSTFCIIALLLLPINLFYNEVMLWLFTTFMPRYLNSNYVTREFGIGVPYMIMMLTTFVVTMVYERMSSKDNTVFRNCTILSIIIVFCASWLPEYQRFVFYFFIPTIAYVPQLLEEDKNTVRRVCVYAALMLVYIWYFMNVYDGMSIVPYKSVLG